MDFATSSNPAVQAQLDRLAALSPGADVLGLARIAELLRRLGDPHLRLPPVFHVAGTNGKGSTCAFLRAALEAEGYRVHAYTSPHLVRFNERIRIAGRLIQDDALAPLLARVLDRAGDVGASFFEVTTVAAFLAFAEVPADAVVLEVGLGGRLDATNVVVDPAVCGIAQLGIDHQSFLGDTIEQIAREKAGIAKPGRPLVTMAYPPAVAAVVADAASGACASLHPAGSDWRFAATAEGVTITDTRGTVTTPRPALSGSHQVDNLGLAAAMLRHQDRLAVSDAAIATAATTALWPARMQRLSHGPLVDRLPAATAVWLDGGHNEAAAGAVAAALRATNRTRVHLVLGMLANKDAAGFLAPLRHVAASLTAVPISGHEHHLPARLAALGDALGISSRTADTLPDALDLIANDAPEAVAILGSLYLAGQALAANDELPA